MDINNLIMIVGGLAVLVCLLIIVILASTGKKTPVEEVGRDFDTEGTRQELVRQLPGLLERLSDRYGDGGSAQGTVFMTGRNDDSYQESYRRAEPQDPLDHYHMALNAIRPPDGDFFVHTRTNLPNKTGLIVMDIAGDWLPGSRKALHTRREIITTAADLLFGAMTDCGFQPGLVLSSSGEIQVLPCGSDPRLASQEIRRMAAASGSCSLADCLDSVGMRRNELEFAVIISDFMSEGWEDKLAAVGSHLSLMVIQIVDPDDVELPMVGRRHFSHGGQIVAINTSKKKVRNDYREEAARRQQSIEAVVRERANGQLFRIKTEEPLDLQLKRLHSLSHQPVLSRA